MPSFSTEVPHTLGQEQAKAKMEHLIDKIGEKYKDQISEVEGGWDGNVLNYAFSSYGIKISGSMAVEDERVKVAGDIPFSAMMFKGKIEEQIKRAVEKALA